MELRRAFTEQCESSQRAISLCESSANAHTRALSQRRAPQSRQRVAHRMQLGCKTADCKEVIFGRKACGYRLTPRMGRTDYLLAIVSRFRILRLTEAGFKLRSESSRRAKSLFESSHRAISLCEPLRELCEAPQSALQEALWGCRGSVKTQRCVFPEPTYFSSIPAGVGQKWVGRFLRPGPRWVGR